MKLGSTALAVALVTTAVPAVTTSADAASWGWRGGWGWPAGALISPAWASPYYGYYPGYYPVDSYGYTPSAYSPYYIRAWAPPRVRRRY